MEGFYDIPTTLRFHCERETNRAIPTEQIAISSFHDVFMMIISHHGNGEDGTLRPKLIFQVFTLLKIPKSTWSVTLVFILQLDAYEVGRYSL